MSRRPVLVCILALTAAGCGTGSDLGAKTASQGPGSPAGSRTVKVVMQSLAFSPTTVKAKVGQTVTWTNEDQAPHNVTYVSGPRFRSSRRELDIGQRFSIRVSEPGTIHYVCTLHSWMKATIVVVR